MRNVSAVNGSWMMAGLSVCCCRSVVCRPAGRRRPYYVGPAGFPRAMALSSCSRARLARSLISIPTVFFVGLTPGPATVKGRSTARGWEERALGWPRKHLFASCAAALRSLCCAGLSKSVHSFHAPKIFATVGVTNRGKGDLSDKRRWQPKKDAQWTTE